MSKSARRPSSDVPGRSRSDSLVRMLELEKLCKMQRIQQNHVSSTTLTNTNGSPRSSLPATIDTPPPQRSRRMSAHPPLSHQTQIMKAVRRSAALPSLSLSIPLAPTERHTMRSNGTADQYPSTKEDRITKSVTFSEPEEDSGDEGANLSDNSSICQSPSWEQYGQKKKKKKKPKKGDEANLKKKGNRLTKTTPFDTFVAKPLTASDRSRSAAELDHLFKSNQENVPPSMIRSQSAMTKPPETAPSEVNGKPKNKGFLSGFKFQHANVAATQKIVELRKTEQDDGTLRAIQYESTIASQQPSLIRPGTESDGSKSRRPPSIRSVMTTSSQSVSSQEKRNSGGRNSTGSGHTRSQSLLSSTLNRLKGPSYLYYRPSEEGVVSDSQDAEPPSMPNKVAQSAHRKAEKAPKQKKQAGIEHAQQPHEFSFPPKPRRANTEPGPDIAPRSRPPRTRKVEIQEPSPSLEETVVPSLRPSGNRRVQIESSAVAPQDTVMAKVMAQEKQSQSSRASQSTRSDVGGAYQSGSRSTALENKRPYTQSIQSEVRYPSNSHGLVRDNSSSRFLHVDSRSASRVADRNDHTEAVERNMRDDDQASVGTHASTIRPASRTQNKKHQVSPYTDGKHTRWYSSEMEDNDAVPDTEQQLDLEDPVEDLITFERERPAAMYQPSQLGLGGSVDYFAFFSESYDPPPLELSSPTESTFKIHSPPIPEDVEDTEQIGLSGDPSLQYDANAKSMGETHEPARDISSAIRPQPKATTRIFREHKTKGSPGISAQHSDSDVPAFERLGLSTKAARILAGVETDSSSTAPSQTTDPSHTTSERSSSSTCDDAPPSISPVTTPDSSRPQSRGGMVDSQPVSSQVTLVDRDDKTIESGRRRFKGAFIETTLRPGYHKDQVSESRDWDHATAPIDLAALPTPTYVKSDGLTSSPLPVATPTSVQFADGVREERAYEEWQTGNEQPTSPAPARTHSALDLQSTAKTLPHPLKSHRLNLKMKEAPSSVSLPNSPPPDATDEVFPRKSALKMSRNHSTNGLDMSSTTSSGATYLQEARRAVPVPPTSSSRALRPHFPQKNSSTSTKSSASSNGRADPLAKMLVECCHCHFFHDMPSRVYECMAKPDSVVEDKTLGVSAAITTTVRCPWCAHGMTTQCCSGYAAVVYLKEKLHGK